MMGYLIGILVAFLHNNVLFHYIVICVNMIIIIITYFLVLLMKFYSNLKTTYTG